MTIPSDPADDECFNLVRSADKDRFLASLFIPDVARPHVLALYAFNIEIARIREVVTNAPIGEIRLQWWRDTLDAIYRGDVPPHPVAQALSRAIAYGQLEQAPFINLIEARTFDLYDDPMPTLNDLEGYLGETSSMLIQLAARLLAGRDADQCAEASGLAGVAYGLTGLLRSLPVHRARGQCYVPREVLERHGTTTAHLIAGRDEGKLAGVLEDLRGHARKRLEEARALRPHLPKRALPAFLPVALTENYLKKLDNLGTGALKSVAEVPQFRRQITLWRRARQESF
jgi:phytoene synthase